MICVPMKPNMVSLSRADVGVFVDVPPQVTVVANPDPRQPGYYNTYVDNTGNSILYLCSMYVRFYYYSLGTVLLVHTYSTYDVSYSSSYRHTHASFHDVGVRMIRIGEERSDYCRTSLATTSSTVLYSNTIPLNSLGTVKQTKRSKAQICTC
jgi:hypothetical protein